MTKFRIFAPSGIEVCTIEAVSKVSTILATLFYDYETKRVGENPICELGEGWVSIPDEIIVKNDNNKPVEVPSFEEAVFNARRFFGRE
jgi:hypothetical protein